MYSDMENDFEETFEVEKKKFKDSLEQENRYSRSRMSYLLTYSHIIQQGDLGCSRIFAKMF